jgi:hypothetical protein
MLTPLPLIETGSNRRLRREQRLWHAGTQHSSLLGCMNCPERTICGGLHIAASVFSCLDHCCGHPESCDTVCRNNPDYVDRIREIDGFDLKTIPQLTPLPAPLLPKVIPWIDHGGQREEPLIAEAVCLPLYTMFNRRTGKTHIPSDLVVDQWSSEGESSLILDFLFLNSVWTTFDHLISDKITPAISTPCDFTTKSGGIWNFPYYAASVIGAHEDQRL